MKKLFLTFFSLIFVFSFLVPNIVIAQEVGVVPTTGSPNKCDIEFIPNISIPGSDFLKAEKGVCINSDSIGYYIVALYKYGAGFAGIVAMFMLVFAGWQWLMAAGRADQISKAKDTIVSVFVGLALLFGGYLLMSQISENSVNFKDIGLARIEPIFSDRVICKKINNILYEGITNQCGSPINMSPANDDSELSNLLIMLGDRVKCISQSCSGDDVCVNKNTYMNCPTVISHFDEEPECFCSTFDCELVWAEGNDCAAYGGNSAMCNGQRCYDETKLPKACRAVGGLPSNKCIDYEGTSCSKNEHCNIDLDGDGNSEYCCVDINNGYDECYHIDDADAGPDGNDELGGGGKYRGCK